MVGGSPEAGRQLAIRRHLRKQKDNDGRILVWVDPDTLKRRTPVQTPVEHPEQTPVRTDDQTGQVNALQAHLQTLQEQLGRERARSDQLECELQEARADADHAQAEQARMAQEVAAMFQELRTLADRHAELHADRGRLEAQIAADAEHRARLEMAVAGLQTELEQDRARITDLMAEGHHQAKEIDRLQAKLARAWWRRLLRR
jgi:chromosome segregation ATPase